MQELKTEINLRHRFMRFRKLQKQYLLNCFEKHNVDLMFKAIEELNIEGYKFYKNY